MHCPYDPHGLDELALFRGVANQELSWLNGHLHQKTFSAGAYVMATDQPGEVIYVILDGSVKVHVDQVDGTEVLLTVLGPGDVVGEMSLLDGAGRSANVVTLEESTLLWMHRSALRECLRRMPQVSLNLMEILCERVRQANERIQSLAALDVGGRVALQILSLARRYGRPTSNGGMVIPIRLTQSDIANLIGASRERVNQIMVSCKERQQISVDQRHHITVHDQEALARRAQLGGQLPPTSTLAGELGTRSAPISHGRGGFALGVSS